jgi:hypothetical protein
MVAYFPSKLTKQMQAVLATVFVMVCLIGTQWLGFDHSISHAKIQQHSISQSSVNGITSTYSHSSDACHLFDALTLSGFVPSSIFNTSIQPTYSASNIFPIDAVIHQSSLSPYLSQGPPHYFI